jgi:hypothetical protein
VSIRGLKDICVNLRPSAVGFSWLRVSDR